MKLYTNKLPKNCLECPCCQYDIVFPCGLSDGTSDYFLDEIDGGDCPLESLTKHDKQVKNEVYKEIWQEFEKKLMNKKEDMSILKVANMINSVLDKLQNKD